MELKKDAWYARWFFWSLGICGSFLDIFPYNLEERTKEKGTNLCFFVQCNLLYAPLILVLNAAAYIGALAVVTAIPIYLFGFVAYLWVAGGILAAILAIFAIYFLSSKLGELNEIKTRQKEKAASNPRFGSLLWAWCAAQKQKVCPLINFSDTKE